MTRTIGCDTSHWSGTINFETMYNAGARFWITKATDAYKVSPIQYEDSKFMEFSTAVFQHGKMLNGCYHWLQASIDPVEAANFYLERYNRFNFHFPPILDFEEVYTIETGKYSDFAWRAQMWLEHIEKKTGRKPIIYTAKWYTDHFKDSYLSWMKAYPLWVADYTWTSNTLGRPTYMPYPWEKQTMWQFSADKNNRGAEFGVGSDDICLDWYEGDYNSLLEFLGTAEIPPIEPPAEPPVEPPAQECIWEPKTSLFNINVREAPTIRARKWFLFPSNHKAELGNKVVVSDKEEWRQLKVWVATKYNGIDYFK